MQRRAFFCRSTRRRKGELFEKCRIAFSGTANVALFLACDKLRMLTGATIPADGGNSAY
jgi:hypothetical protein